MQSSFSQIIINFDDSSHHSMLSTESPVGSPSINSAYDLDDFLIDGPNVMDSHHNQSYSSSMLNALINKTNMISCYISFSSLNSSSNTDHSDASNSDMSSSDNSIISGNSNSNTNSSSSSSSSNGNNQISDNLTNMITISTSTTLDMKSNPKLSSYISSAAHYFLRVLNIATVHEESSYSNLLTDKSDDADGSSSELEYNNRNHL